MEVKQERVRSAIGYSGLAVVNCGIGISGGVGMTTLGGDAGCPSSRGRRIGRRIERGQARVFRGVARGGFACGGLLLVAQRWIS